MLYERSTRVTAGHGPGDELVASDQHLPSVFLLYATFVS